LIKPRERRLKAQSEKEKRKTLRRRINVPRTGEKGNSSFFER